MDEQRDVAAFIERHDLETPAAYRLLDLVAELGEVSKEALDESLTKYRSRLDEAETPGSGE